MEGGGLGIGPPGTYPLDITLHGVHTQVLLDAAVFLTHQERAMPFTVTEVPIAVPPSVRQPTVAGDDPPRPTPTHVTMLTPAAVG